MRRGEAEHNAKLEESSHHQRRAYDEGAAHRRPAACLWRESCRLFPHDARGDQRRANLEPRAPRWRPLVLSARKGRARATPSQILPSYESRPGVRRTGAQPRQTTAQRPRGGGAHDDALLAGGDVLRLSLQGCGGDDGPQAKGGRGSAEASRRLIPLSGEPWSFPLAAPASVRVVLWRRWSSLVISDERSGGGTAQLSYNASQARPSSHEDFVRRRKEQLQCAGAGVILASRGCFRRGANSARAPLTKSNPIDSFSAAPLATVCCSLHHFACDG